MSRKLGDTIYLDFTTHRADTGAVTDADSTPTCVVFEDDNDTPILSPTVTKRTGYTGVYRVPIAATAGNGFEVGKSYNVDVTAVVNSVTAKARIGAFTLDGKRVSDLNDLAQADILSDATPFAGANVDAAVSSRPTAVQIEAYLAAIHGAGSWEGGVPPTPAEIEAYLATHHGSGSWQKGAEFPV